LSANYAFFPFLAGQVFPPPSTPFFPPLFFFFFRLDQSLFPLPFLSFCCFDIIVLCRLCPANPCCRGFFFLGCVFGFCKNPPPSYFPFSHSTPKRPLLLFLFRVSKAPFFFDLNCLPLGISRRGFFFGLWLSLNRAFYVGCSFNNRPQLLGYRYDSTSSFALWLWKGLSGSLSPFLLIPLGFSLNQILW